MSRIEKKMKDLKSRRIREGWKDGKKVSVSFRLDPFTVFCLDEIVKEVGGTRTSNGTELVTEGVLDCLSALGRDFDSLQNEYFAQAGTGLFLDGIKVDDPQDLIDNPSKYGVPVHDMTEEDMEDLKDREEAEKEQGDK